jgi:hypothetical protein
MATWTGLGDNMELFWVVLSQACPFIGLKASLSTMFILPSTWHHYGNGSLSLNVEGYIHVFPCCTAPPCAPDRGNWDPMGRVPLGPILTQPLFRVFSGGRSSKGPYIRRSSVLGVLRRFCPLGVFRRRGS